MGDLSGPVYRDPPPPPADRNVYGALMAAGAADVFITYCTNVVIAQREEPALKRIDVPAEVLTGPGREFLQSGQMQSDVAARIRVPWFPGGIDASWRVLWDGRVFDIKGDPDLDASGRREYRIKCKAGVNDGQ